MIIGNSTAHLAWVYCTARAVDVVFFVRRFRIRFGDMYRQVIAACILALVAATTTATANATPLPFRAEYTGTYEGVPVKAKGVRELNAEENGTFRFVSSASSMFISVSETSRFTAEDGSFVPIEYRHERKSLGKNRVRTNTFDWTGMTTTWTKKKEKGDYPVESGTLDRLLYQLQLRTDLKSLQPVIGETTLSYTIADNDDLRHYTFLVSGEEVLETEAGAIDTIKLERVREDSYKQTWLWLAKAHDYLLVRLKQVESDGGFELNLISATIDGDPLTGQ